MNSVHLIGNIGQDIELRRTGSGKAVTDLRLAINDGGNDPTWVGVVVWDQQAENCAKYLRRGSKVAIEGRLSVSGWETREGEKRTRLEVVAYHVEFLSPKDSDTRHAQDHDQQPSRTTERSYSADRSGTDINDDSIPF